MELLIIGIIALAAFLLIGGFSTDRLSDAVSIPSEAAYQCCDSGNGANCKPSEDLSKRFRFPDPTTGDEYALLKTDIILVEDVRHIKYSGFDVPATGERIFINTSDEAGGGCRGDEKRDMIFAGPPGGRCVAIENDLLIYTCKDCPGDVGEARFDAYIRLKDAQLGIPDPIRNCKATSNPGDSFRLKPPPDEPGEQSLQLKTYIIEREPKAPWLSPYCKPAIYLYPETQTNVNVSIKPQGKLTLTIPQYPPNGWSVLANPSGQINYQSKTFDYLYYEAEIPDNLIEEPKEGYVIEQNGLTKLFADLLPKLGLNSKESSQFADYWLKALPKSPYYFVGIISQNNLNTIAPLTINPLPNAIIRVTLYFKALEEKIEASAPTITPVVRNGFTAVEWGGIVKTDPSHPFSCLM